MSRTMKDSGIPWIGEIPSHWRTELIGSCIKEVNNPNTDNAENNALQFKMGTIISKKGGDSKYNPETLVAYNKVQQGDIIINGLNLSFDFISQRVGLVKENGVITSTYLALRPLPLIDSRFLNYLFKGYDYCKALHSMGRGLRATLGYNEFRKYSVFFPSIHEQQAIADFLDKKCVEIDEMVSLQEKIVEELKAYKHSVITEAVCKGLNPDVPTKDSGIEWIGEIPEGWRITTIGRLFSISAGGDAKWEIYSDTKDEEHPYPVYTNTLDKNQTYAFTSRPVFKGDTITVTGRGDIGHAFYRDTPFDAIIRLLVLDKKYPLDCRYFAYFIDNVIHFFTNSAAIGQLSAVQVVPYNVCHPSFEEQQAIADYLDIKCSEIDALISLKQSKIEALKEFKKSIIYEYITGKKEVVL